MPKKGEVIKNYKVVKKIGRGGFGDVYLVESIIAPYEQAVLKIIENTTVNEETKIGLTLSAKCPFLVKFKEVFTEDEELCVVMEYCSGGDLDKYVKEKNKLTDIDIYRFIYESGMAIKAIHDAGFIHRDIKLSNFFLVLTGGFKLGDYGLVRSIDSVRTMTAAGTESFLSPEIMKGGSAPYSRKSDIYAWGVTLIILIAGHGPFCQANGMVNMELALKGKPVQDILNHPHPVMPLALSMISLDPSTRPTVETVLATQFPLRAIYAAALSCGSERAKLRDECTKLKQERDAAVKERERLEKEKNDAEKLWPQDVAMQFVVDKWSRDTFTVEGGKVVWTKTRCDFAILAEELTTGIYAIEVEFDNISGNVTYVGLLSPALLNRDRSDDLFIVSGQCCIGHTRGYGKMFCGDKFKDNGRVYTAQDLFPADRLTHRVRLELDTGTHVVYFFVDGRQIPHCVTDVPAAVHFALSNEFISVTTVLLFQRLPALTVDKTLQCKLYKWK